MTTRNRLSGGSPPPREGAPGGEGVAPVKAARIRALPEPEADLACARLPLTDLGNAERWRVRHGDDFRFCDVMGWFMWDGRRWKLLSEEKDALPAEVMQTVFTAIRAIRNEAALIASLGCERPEGLSGVKLENFVEWAQARQDEGLDRYLRGDDDGERSDWLSKCEVRDFALSTAPGTRKLWSDTIAAHAKASETSGKLASVARLAKSFADIAIRPEQLDQDRMAINVLNGTLRLVPDRRRRTEAEKAEWIARERQRQAGEESLSQAPASAGASSLDVQHAAPAAGGRSALPPGEAGRDRREPQPPEWITQGWRVKRFPHDRADLITKLAPVKFAPSAACPSYDAFIARVQPDAAMRRFIHQWGGLSLTGDIGEQKLAFFYGSGRNGKGTWVEAVAHLAGDYAGSIPIESFLDNGIKRRGDQATPDLARLPGVRFLRVSEPEKNARLNEGLIKMVTGGDPVDARHLNKGFFTFLPDFKMTISGNHKPQVKDTSDGIWRRMQLVPWEVTIAASEVDRSLPETLRGEASGILNRLLEGLCDWQAAGLIEPDAVTRATAAYRDQSDELGRFLSATCVVGEDDPPARPCRVKAKALHEAYIAWCDEAGGAHWKASGFKAAMIDKGFAQKTSNGVWWIGIALRDGVDAEAIRSGHWDGPGEPESSSSAAVGHYDAGDPGWSSADDWIPGDEGMPGD